MEEEPLKRQPLNPRNLKHQRDEMIVMNVEQLIADQTIVVIAVVIVVVIAVIVAIAVVVVVVVVAAEAVVVAEVEAVAVEEDVVVMITTALVDVSTTAAVVLAGVKTAPTKIANSVGEAMALMSTRKLKVTCPPLM